MSHVQCHYTGAEETAALLEHPSQPPVLCKGQRCTSQGMAINVVAVLTGNWE